MKMIIKKRLDTDINVEITRFNLEIINDPAPVLAFDFTLNILLNDLTGQARN